MKMSETQGFKNFKNCSDGQIEGFIKNQKNFRTKTKGSF